MIPEQYSENADREIVGFGGLMVIEASPKTALAEIYHPR